MFEMLSNIALYHWIVIIVHEVRATSTQRPGLLSRIICYCQFLGLAIF